MSSPPSVPPTPPSTAAPPAPPKPPAPPAVPPAHQPAATKSVTPDTVPPLSFSLPPFNQPPPPANATATAAAAPSPAPFAKPPATTPAPPPPAAPSVAKPAGLSRRAKWLIIAGTGALVLLLAAALTWSHFSKRVPEAELIAWLHTQSNAGLAIQRLTHTAVPQSDGTHIITFEAAGTVPAALYVREDTPGYLRRTLSLSPASSDDTREAATAAADPRIRERAGISDTPADPLEAVVLRETTAAGMSFPFNGVANASRVEGQWRFTLLQGKLSSPALEGKPRASFGEKTFLAGRAEDDDALRLLVEKQNDIVSRIKKAAAEVAAENKRDRESRILLFHSLLVPGTLFTGTSSPATGGETEAVSLEITAAKPGSEKIAALLRNSGGWTDARPFTGTWKLDDATGVFTLTLVSHSNQAIDSAGPILAAPDALTLALHLDDNGRLTSAADSDVPFRAKRLDSSDHTARGKLSARLTAALDATKPDTLYHGIATAKASGSTEQVFLRFKKQSDQGTSLTATFESAEPGTFWKRPLRGAVIDNRHRTGDQPIRLQLSGSGHSRSAKPGTLFARSTDSSPAFKIDGNQLVGEDAAFTYAFTRISAAQAVALKKAIASAPGASAAVSNGPRSSGLHAEVDGLWTTLPRNGGSTSSGLGGFAKGLFSKNKDADKPAFLVFKGSTPPPVFDGDELTLTFKGKISARAKGVPADYPPIEAARTAAQEDGTRSVALARIAPGFTGFGDARIPATLEQVAPEIWTITFNDSLAPGTYAVLVGTDGYEFTVK